MTLTDSNGTQRSVVTISFGYYKFDAVEPGRTYTISIESRRCRFVPRRLQITENLADVDFVGLE